MIDPCFVEMYNHHGPLQILNNFNFKLIYFLFSLPQDGVSSCSSSWHYAFVSPYERSFDALSNSFNKLDYKSKGENSGNKKELGYAP
jgi:hypothetical protein